MGSFQWRCADTQLSAKEQGCQQGHCLTDLLPCFSSSCAIDSRQGEHDSLTTGPIPCGRKGQHRAAAGLCKASAETLVWSQHGKGSDLTPGFASCWMGREPHTSEITSSYHRNQKHFSKVVKSHWMSFLHFGALLPRLWKQRSCLEDWWK